MLLISLGNVLKQNVVKLMCMRSRHNSGMQHLAYALYIIINAFYPLSYYALTSRSALSSPTWPVYNTSLPLCAHTHTLLLKNATVLSIQHGSYYIHSTLLCVSTCKDTTIKCSGGGGGGGDE